MKSGGITRKAKKLLIQPTYLNIDRLCMKLLACLALKFCRRTWKVLMHTRVLKDNTEKWGLSIFFTKIRENELEIFSLSNFSIISYLHKKNCARLTTLEIVFLSLSFNKVSFKLFHVSFGSSNS